MATLVKVMNLASRFECWIPDHAIDRAVPANGPHDGCIALMPDDWPSEHGEFDDTANLWTVLRRLDAGGVNLIPPDHTTRPSPEEVNDAIRRRGYAVHPHDHHLG
jgi:hypothetical protein